MRISGMMSDVFSSDLDEGRVVDGSPVRGDGRPPPRAQEMKGDGANDHHNQQKCDDHVFCILTSGSCGQELLGTDSVAQHIIALVPGAKTPPPGSQNAIPDKISLATGQDRMSDV